MSNVHPIPGDNDHEGAQVTTPIPDDDTPDPLGDIRSGIKAMFNFGITLGNSIDAHTRSVDRLMRKLQRNTPVDYGIGVSGVYPAAGNLVLSFGGPDQGTFWELESVVLGGTDENVTVAGSAGLYVSAFLPPSGTSAPGGITSLSDLAKALPNVAFYGKRDIVVNDGEYLFAVIIGGTPGTTYGGNMSATVTPTDVAGGVDVDTL